MTRKELIRRMLLGTTTLILLPEVFTGCSKGSLAPGRPNEITIDLGSPAYASLNTAGNSVIISGVIVANTGNGNFVALDSICTHQGCTISYSYASNNFPCPCHGSVFSSTGAVLAGPAPVPLRSYPVIRTGNILSINLT